jgi:hypothetical protein
MPVTTIPMTIIIQPVIILVPLDIPDTGAFQTLVLTDLVESIVVWQRGKILRQAQVCLKNDSMSKILNFVN